MKRPAFQFYPADWRKDNQLQSCSLAAQGFWMNAMCIAHECEPYGHLVLNGHAMNAPQLAKLIGITPKEAEKAIAELEHNGVVSRCANGCMYSRRMVRDEGLRQRRADGGAAGAEHGVKGGRPRRKNNPLPNPLDEPARGSERGLQNNPPSSSSSPSGKNSEPNGSGGKPPNQDADAIFANGVALLQSAGVSDRNARSMLGLMRNQHGDKAVAEALRRCAEVQAIEPVAWLQAALKSKSGTPTAASIAQEAMRLHDQRESANATG